MPLLIMPSVVIGFDFMISFKILVLGSQGSCVGTIGVGKSSLIMRYLKGEFLDSYNVTVGV